MALNLDLDLYRQLLEHVGHEVAVANYAGVNVAIECLTCGVVLLDADKPHEHSWTRQAIVEACTHDHTA